MDKLTLKIEYTDFLNNDLENYLKDLNGVKIIKINNDKNEIYVEYDSNIISLRLLKREILLYLDLVKIPSIVAFNKNFKNGIRKDCILIKDLCCEYCLNGMIEELLEIDGIESAYTDFDYNNKFNVNIFITYNDEIIGKEKINELNFKKISFRLSDSTMPIYNAIMEKIGWKHSDKTELFMSIDRNPKERKDLRLQSAQGKIMMPEESLIWIPATIIHKLEGKVDEETLKKAIKLKEIVFQYYARLNSLYHTEDFTEFDKIWLAYDFIKRHISFANEATRYENGRQVLYNPNNRYDFVSEPLGTYQHKKGVCEGQARFMQALLNNQYFKSDTVAINGVCPLGNHVWVGSVVNNQLYQTCLTMAGPFKDLGIKGYVPDVSEVYPKIYGTSSLSNQELMQIQSHIKRLRK